MKKGALVRFRGKRPGGGRVEVMTGVITETWARGKARFARVTNEWGSWEKLRHELRPADAVTQLGEVVSGDPD